MKIPDHLNLVRLTGLFGPARLPKGFSWAPGLEGDWQKYAVRDGYQIQVCPNAATHGFNRGCSDCAPFRGAIAVMVRPMGEIPIDHQAKSSGALGSPERNHTCPACFGTGKVLLKLLGAVCCPRCAGCGERKANREPADHAFPGVRSCPRCSKSWWSRLFKQSLDPKDICVTYGGYDTIFWMQDRWHRSDDLNALQRLIALAKEAGHSGEVWVSDSDWEILSQ